MNASFVIVPFFPVIQAYLAKIICSFTIVSALIERNIQEIDVRNFGYIVIPKNLFVFVEFPC